MAQEQPLQLLQTVRERIKPSAEAAYGTIEDGTARACADLRCPHPHVALETLIGPKEVWWFNFFESEDQRQQITSEYERNRRLMKVLTRNSERKSRYTGESTNVLLTFRPDVSRDVASWQLPGRRFVVVTMVSDTVESQGLVFSAPNGEHFVLQPVKTRSEAERLSAGSEPNTIALGVRPSWGMPAPEWIEADPGFWTSNPSVSSNRTP